MTSVVKVSFAFVFAGLMSLSSGAQTTTTKATIVTLPPAANCPVALRAQHGVDGSVVAVSGKAHHGIGQQIELTLNNPGNTAISSIRITFHGWNGKGRTLPAGAANSSDTTASRTLELKVSIAPHTSKKTALWVSGLTSVDSIDLDEVRYAKGLSWRSSATQVCRIVPDGEMLISHR